MYLPILTSDLSEATLDGRDRLTLPKEIRERYGERYRIVQFHDGIKLISIEDEDWLGDAAKAVSTRSTSSNPTATPSSRATRRTSRSRPDST